MEPPVTQEEIDRRANVDNRIRYISDFMGQLTDIEDKATKLKIYKSLISDVVNNSEVLQYLQEYIESLSKTEDDKTDDSGSDESFDEIVASDSDDMPSLDDTAPLEALAVSDTASKEVLVEESEEEDAEDYLPSPDELAINLV